MQTNMTIKGQVTVPKPVRDRLGLRPGRPVSFVENADGDFVIRPVDAADDREARRLDMLARIDAIAGQGFIGEDTDSFMATIREPVPL